MRILVLRQAGFPRDPRVKREVDALIARGHDVDVVCLRWPGEPANEVVGGVRVLRLPLAHRRAGVARYVWEYGAFFAAAAVIAALWHLRRRYALVQVNTLPDLLVFAALVPKLTGAHVLLDLHEAMPELARSAFGWGPRHLLVRALATAEQAAIRFADACLAVSEPCLARYVERGARRAKFTVVMNTADPALFAPRRPRSQVDPAGDGRARLVSHGTLVERHGFDVLIRALAEVPRARLEILGDGETRPALERLAAELGIADRVTFAGFVPLQDIPGRISQAQLGVVANRRDVFTDLVVPTKLMEYAALGIPVVVARTPAVEAYFDNSMVAFFAPGDSTDLAHVIASLIADPARGDSLVAQAEAHFNARYGGPVMAERYLGVVEALGGQRAGHT